jgi:dephospho-CoA kinase
MSAWPGKYVIGLTGNIGTGKSVTRKMLEHLGAYGIDADALAHRAIAPDAPGYQPVIAALETGCWPRMGRSTGAGSGEWCFRPEASRRKRSCPLVRQAVDALAACSPAGDRHRSHQIARGSLRRACDAIWVTTTSPEVQLARLVEKRALSVENAQQRIAAQPPQSQKLAAADVVIRNEGTFEQTWQQVQAAWKKTVPVAAREPVAEAVAPRGILIVERAGPRHAEEIAAFITRLSKGRRTASRDDVMAAFGEKAFLLLRVDGRLVGLVGWQVENLVARTADVLLEPGLVLGDAMRVILGEVERASNELQCEVSLLFLPPQLARHNAVWHALGYEPRPVHSLGTRAWQEAVEESMPMGTVLFFKQRARIGFAADLGPGVNVRAQLSGAGMPQTRSGGVR